MRTPIILAYFLWTGVAAAQAPSGTCMPPIDSVSADSAARFLENPSMLLDGYKEGTGGLAAAVRDLATMRPETVNGMPSLANSASSEQLRAIGSGLGTAAAICVLARPEIAQRIQEAILKANKPEMAQTFTSIVGDIATEAIPDLPLNGDTTPGGGRGSTPPEQAGGATVANSLVGTLPGVVSGVGGTSDGRTIASAALIPATAVVLPVSPAQ
jgi:hypothetical protein